MILFDIAGVGQALTSLKAIADLIKGANDAQLALKITPQIIGLQSQLLEVQQKALGIWKQNIPRFHVVFRACA